MKKVLSLVLSLMMVFGLTMGAFAAPISTTVEGQHGEVMVIETHNKYTVTLGASGDNYVITRVDRPSAILSENLKKNNADANNLASVSFTATEVYGNGKTNQTMTIHYREKTGSKIQKMSIRLEIYPQEVYPSDFEEIRNGISYQMDGSEVDFDFYNGYINVKSSNQKPINLSYDQNVTEADIAKFTGLVTVYNFKGEAKLNSVGSIHFDSVVDGEKVYIYKYNGEDDYTLLTLKDGKYTERATHFGKYYVFNSDYGQTIQFVSENGPTEIVESTNGNTVTTAPENVNQNPSTGR